jgi:hypothetical protein
MGNMTSVQKECKMDHEGTEYDVWAFHVDKDRTMPRVCKHGDTSSTYLQWRQFLNTDFTLSDNSHHFSLRFAYVKQTNGKRLATAVRYSTPLELHWQTNLSQGRTHTDYFILKFIIQRIYDAHTLESHAWTNFPKIYKPPQNSRRQSGDMKQVLYEASTNIRCHHKLTVANATWRSRFVHPWLSSSVQTIQVTGGHGMCPKWNEKKRT